MKIKFTGNYVEDFVVDSVSFEAVVDDKRVVCKISREALEDNFPSLPETPITDIYKDNREEIEAVASQLIITGRYDNDGIVRIYNNDIRNRK